MKVKKIFSKKIAIQLIVNGNELIYTEPNKYKNWLSVFCFEETPNLLKNLTEITKH
jgi:hypothetical protein